MSEEDTQSGTEPTTVPVEEPTPVSDSPDEPAQASDAADEGETVAAERDRLKDQLLRTAAELDNFRKRTKRDLVDAEHRGREAVLREVLTVIDNLERAVATSSNATEVATVLEGVQMVLKNFNDVAKNLGLERLAGVGERFDPAIHDAIQQIETEEHPPGTVVAEIVPGYRLRDKLLRASMVVVSKMAQRPPSAKAGSTEAGSTAGDATPETSSDE